MEKEKIFKIIKISIITIITITLIILYARYIGTSGIHVKEYPIKTSYLPTSYDGFKIVHFSDLHYGSTVSIKEVKKLVNKINEQNPDLVVFTGDLIDQDYSLSEEEREKIIKELGKLDANIEILAVIGNHDYKTDDFTIISEFLEWNFLDNTYEYVYNKSEIPIVFVGLDDLMLGDPDYNNAFSYLNEIDGDYYTVVLGHEPDQIDEISNYDFNLFLSGHSHLGQVRVPLIGAVYTPKGSKKYYDEHYKVKNAELYINNGIGTSILKLRLFNRPSINLYRFYTN
ncbi:MAG: metallophosphoesterase [Erysipelotrichales bacterium]|nr:metallophosphoesterase [Erysipelotrichales bacterium]